MKLKIPISTKNKVNEKHVIKSISHNSNSNSNKENLSTNISLTPSNHTTHKDIKDQNKIVPNFFTAKPNFEFLKTSSMTPRNQVTVKSIIQKELNSEDNNNNCNNNTIKINNGSMSVRKETNDKDYKNTVTSNIKVVENKSIFHKRGLVCTNNVSSLSNLHNNTNSNFVNLSKVNEVPSTNLNLNYNKLVKDNKSESVRLLNIPKQIQTYESCFSNNQLNNITNVSNINTNKPVKLELNKINQNQNSQNTTNNQESGLISNRTNDSNYERKQGLTTKNSTKSFKKIPINLNIQQIENERSGNTADNSKTPKHVNNNNNINFNNTKVSEDSLLTINQEYSKLELNLENKPMLDKVKISTQNYGVVQGYSASTNQGKIRNYNEDRVSIILNINKPSSKVYDKEWPKCSFFGIYDGHAGSSCADFLRDNLHKYIINDSNFPDNPQKAILNGFLTSERVFLEYSLNSGNKSGSCALIILILENKCFVANLGDSRALMSGNFGEKTYVLSRDHRPGDEKEYKRIIDAGGKIYQTEANIISKDRNESILGPLRVKPGKLSVSRTIGDIEAKLPQFGGNPNVIIGVPEIKYFDLNESYDFILLGCK